ncbi:MAG: biotin-independent malonate decarboxylase subunit beta [Gammaproteobacteria bacterium]|nr:MAG: biotin-independent malonate decarboxylase subunit beta [Gammaproteobacteria bacterium]
MSTAAPHERLLTRHSFIELPARERARAILDADSFRELLGPFDRLKSPWLPLQGIVAQSDDGVVIARGRIGGRPAVVAAIEGAFQGGSIGEVSGAKVAGALELALRDNLGLAAIAEIHSAIVALRRRVPVVAVVAGMVGCFGGMSLAAALCSTLIVTRQARLGMNGPEVIEQEAGIAELDSTDHALIWSLVGGEQRYATGLADALVDDDAEAIAAQVRSAVERVAAPRSEQVECFLERLAHIDPENPPEPRALRALWAREDPDGH